MSNESRQASDPEGATFQARLTEGPMREQPTHRGFGFVELSPNEDVHEIDVGEARPLEDRRPPEPPTTSAT